MSTVDLALTIGSAAAAVMWAGVLVAPPRPWRTAERLDAARPLAAVATGAARLATPIALLVGAWLLCTSSAPAAQPQDPGDVVRQLQQMILGAMQDAGDFDSRAGRIATVMDQTFDFPRIARLSLGRHWRGLDGAQRAQFVERFRVLGVATFASRFSSYGGERFETGAARALPRGGAAVVSHMVKPGAEPVEFEYHLHETTDGWRIVNILADGISDLALKRAEYNSVMQERGFRELLQRLQEQTAALRGP